ncbi:MAG: hypothetical protein M3065_07935 [Actinomycetota bacterium]|nr:hypothetical protein [Actinomycetota bacterium]
MTPAIREIDTDVELGPEDGIPVARAVSLVNLRTRVEALLTESITQLGAERMDAICRAPALGC